MPIEFGELPESTRGRAALSPITVGDVKKLEDNPGRWAKAAKDVLTGQNFVSWAKAKNAGEEGPWYVATRGHRLESGELHTAEKTVAAGENKGKKYQVRYVDVWVCYSPDGKPKELQPKS